MNAARAKLGFLVLSITNIVSAFDLTAHHQFDCLSGTALFVCFNHGYNYCCQDWYNTAHTRNIPFLSMSQSSTVSGDILVLHSTRYTGEGCSGASVGSSIYGCANAELNQAFGGMAHSCTGNCAKRSAPACLGTRQADGVYYNQLAYDAKPDDPRLDHLIGKIRLNEEELTDSELQELEVLRMPFADESERLAGRDMGKAYIAYKQSKTSNSTVVSNEPKTSKEFKA